MLDIDCGKLSLQEAESCQACEGWTPEQPFFAFHHLSALTVPPKRFSQTGGRQGFCNLSHCLTFNPTSSTVSVKTHEIKSI
jgi:hypothetical protein